MAGGWAAAVGMGGASALTILSVVAATPAFGQTATASPTAERAISLDVITVTGEKIERDQKNTASSVSVITGKDIEKEKTGDATVSEVVAGVPNVVYTDTVSAPVIRGQDTQGPLTGQYSFWGGTVPRATINLDGHYLNYSEYYFGATSVWDVKSVEVFRGPQTTSQGANAIAGAIIVNTKDPTFKPEGAYQAEIGSYNTRRTSVMVSGPLVENQLAARLAIDYSARDTFIDYVSPNFQKGQTDQDFRALNARFKLLWLPTEISGLEAKLTYAHNASNRPGQEAASAPYENLQHVTTTMPTWNQTTDTGIFDLKYDFYNGFKLFNQTQYTNSSVHRVAPVASNGNADIEQRNVSNETRVTFGDQSTVLSGLAGVYYGYTKTDEVLYLSGLSTFDDRKSNLGVFGELTYKLTDRWTLNGGLRTQHDHIQRLGVSVYAPGPVDYDNTFTVLLPKMSLAYALTPGWTVGALVSRGYNPGGVSLNLNSRQWMSFEDESLWNYELFTRANLLNDTLTLNSNVFYMDFKNAQYNIPVVISTGVAQTYVINAEKAHAYGLEVGIDYRVLQGLTLKAGAGVLQTKIDQISSNVSYEGNEFAKSPGYMLSFGASWDATDKLNVSGEVRHLDRYYSDVANTVKYSIDPYTIADVRVSYQFHQLAQVYGYVKNVFDERAPTYMQENRGIGGTEASMTAPRMFGIGLRGTF
ncbi:TonB-dependent receptor [Rhodopseudomonas palustris]